MGAEMRRTPHTPPHPSAERKVPPPLECRISLLLPNAILHNLTNEIMESITTYSFSIETSGGNWRTSPEYPTEEDCFAAALRCKKSLGKKFTRITFVDNMKYSAKEGV